MHEVKDLLVGLFAFWAVTPREAPGKSYPENLLERRVLYSAVKVLLAYCLYLVNPYVGLEGLVHLAIVARQRGRH